MLRIICIKAHAGDSWMEVCNSLMRILRNGATGGNHGDTTGGTDLECANGAACQSGHADRRRGWYFFAASSRLRAVQWLEAVRGRSRRGADGADRGTPGAAA